MDLWKKISRVTEPRRRALLPLHSRQTLVLEAFTASIHFPRNESRSEVLTIGIESSQVRRTHESSPSIVHSKLMIIRMLKSVKGCKRKVNEEKVCPWHKIVRVYRTLKPPRKSDFRDGGKGHLFYLLNI